MNIYLDIETLPCTNPDVIADLHAAIKPPGNLKKAETIEAWWQEEGEKAKAEVVAKTSFDGLYGRICVISMAVDNEEPISFSGDNEKELLADAFAWINERTSIAINYGYAHSPVTFVGHNLVSFDLPFIKQRSIIHAIKPPIVLIRAMAAKPWGSEIADTMLMWSSDPHKRGSMDRLCKAFGIKGKDRFDGSMVAATWPVDPFKVIEYCQDDVARTREMYKRITWE